jgi:hypothetical protein
MSAAIELLKTIQNESVISDAEQVFPVAATHDVDYVRQGDVYIWAKSKVPKNAKQIKSNSQLAPGTTKGSRHCLDSLDGVTMYAIEDANELQGPIIERACERLVTHPEHGDWRLGAGVYEITYQRAFAEELRRVRD